MVFLHPCVSVIIWPVHLMCEVLRHSLALLRHKAVYEHRDDVTSCYRHS